MRYLSLLMILCWMGCPEPQKVNPQGGGEPKEEVEEEPQGGEGEPCFDNGNCLPGLLCNADDICETPPPYDAGTGTSDGSGDGSSDGNTDGDSDGWADFLGGGDEDAGPTEIVGWGEMCGSLITPGPDCDEGLICGFLSGVCEELCDTPGHCTNCCPISGTGYCEAGILVNFCKWASGTGPTSSTDAGTDAGPVLSDSDAGMSFIDAGTAPNFQDGGLSDAGSVAQDSSLDAGSESGGDAGLPMATDGGAESVLDAGSGQSSAAPDGGADLSDAGQSQNLDSGLPQTENQDAGALEGDAGATSS